MNETRYYPFGEVRWSSGSMPTDRTFTGQRVESESAVGSLMDYGARFYSPALGRFISADSIVPQPGDSQSLNRYAYTLNNPLTYIDPTGHDVGCAGSSAEECGSPIPLPAWDEVGEGLSPEEQQRAIAAYVSLVTNPDLWAQLFADPKAWDASPLPVDLLLFMYGTGLGGFTAESLVYTRLGDVGPALNEQRAANFAKQYGYSNGFVETTARLSPDVLGTAGMIWANWPKDFQTSNTKLFSSWYKSEGEARAIARQKLGANPVEIEPGKWRSTDGKWQYRALTVDLEGDRTGPHIHLEELNPSMGEVKQNYHFRWPTGTNR